jgi:hypothetical protein
MQSGNINFLEPSGPLQACNGTALPFTFNSLKTKNNLIYIEGPSSYRSVNTLRLDYENQSFNAE